MKKLGRKIYRKIKGSADIIFRIYIAAMLIGYSIILNSGSVYAGPFDSSVFATGTKNLATDIGKWLLILAPISGSLVAIYFFIRRQAADEMDQKKWNDRIKAAIISTIGAVLVSAIIVLIASYYGKTVDTGI